MGTDIHGVWQAKVGGKWVDVPSEYEQDRHYFLFAWLGNVRNGFGFAGVPTHETIMPLSDGRGIPDGFAFENEMHPVASVEELRRIDPQKRHFFDEENEPPQIWMGEHSYSWVSADEVLNTALPKYTRTGVIPLKKYREWDKKSHPGDHCGMKMGWDVVVSTPKEINERTTDVFIEWEQDGAEEVKYFIDEVRRLKDLHGEVRFVFGFDS